MQPKSLKPNSVKPNSVKTVTYDAWAKINLTLHVVGRRPDDAAAAGFHELDSLIVFAGVGDRVLFTPAAELSLVIEGPFAGKLCADDDNLVLRAARLLRQCFNVGKGAAVRLIKNLPVASGIGGGSADAAAALLGLIELWGLTVRRRDLIDIAAQLGADVPVCLDCSPTIIGGIGEILIPAPPLPSAWFLLVNPGIALSTPAVFAARSGPFSNVKVWPETVGDVAAFADQLGACGNDLEGPARALAPQIDDVLAAIAGSADCLLARMSGSGATCFGIYAGQEQAEAAATAMAAEQPAWWISAAPMITGRIML